MSPAEPELSPTAFGTAEVPAGQRATISILLCNYNDSRFLPDSLGAFAAQTRAADEIVIVDDGSTDNSWDILTAYAEKHSNVRLVRNESNKGLMFSINRAIETASMDYLVWAAADDKLLPAFVERNLAVLEQHPGAVMSFSQLATFDDETGAVSEFSYATHRDAFDLGPGPHFLSSDAFVARLKRSYVWMSGNTVVISKKALLAFGGFSPDLRWHADWYAYYMMGLRHGACLMPDVLAMMRTRPGTYSSEGMQRKKEHSAVMGRMIGTLLRPANLDLYWKVVQRPVIMSPFGRPLLLAAARNPLAWPIAVRFLGWMIKHKWQASGGAAALKQRIKQPLRAIARRVGYVRK